jgi:hypothetical protein
MKTILPKQEPYFKTILLNGIQNFVFKRLSLQKIGNGQRDLMFKIHLIKTILVLFIMTLLTKPILTLPNTACSSKHPVHF